MAEVRRFCEQNWKEIRPDRDLEEIIAIVKEVSSQRRGFTKPCRFWDSELTRIKRLRTKARRLQDWDAFRKFNAILKCRYRQKKKQRWRDDIRNNSEIPKIP